MKRLNCYRPYKEYANKLQDWRQAARSRDWVGTRFKGLESPYGATFSELFRYVDTAQKHRELSRETRKQLQQRIETVFLESIPQLPLTLGAAADVKVPSLFGILVRCVGDKVECVCVCGQETVATSSRSPVFTVLLLVFLVAEKWRWTLSQSRKWAPGGPKGWPRGFLAPKPPLGSQHVPDFRGLPVHMDGTFTTTPQ